MKKVVFAVAAVAVALVFALPSFAQDAKTKAEKPTHHDFTGTITAVDAAKNTVTVKNKDGEKTFVVTDKSKITTADKNVPATLADLKVGEKVKVTFTDNAGTLTATKITQVPEKAAASPGAPATK